jgi:hypothetical protein
MGGRAELAMRPACLAFTACWTLLSLGCATEPEAGETTARHSDPDLHARALRTPVSKAIAQRRIEMSTSIERKANTVEVRVEAGEPFLIGAMPPVLVIGDKAFGRSRFAEGRVDVLIFLIDAAEYATLPAGAEARVGYLSSSARLEPGKPASGSAPATGPRILPSQVEPNRHRLGVLQAGGMKVLP